MRFLILLFSLTFVSNSHAVPRVDYDPLGDECTGATERIGNRDRSNREFSLPRLQRELNAGHKNRQKRARAFKSFTSIDDVNAAWEKALKKGRGPQRTVLEMLKHYALDAESFEKRFEIAEFLPTLIDFKDFRDPFTPVIILDIASRIGFDDQQALTPVLLRLEVLLRSQTRIQSRSFGNISRCLSRLRIRDERLLSALSDYADTKIKLETRDRGLFMAYFLFLLSEDPSLEDHPLAKRIQSGEIKLLGDHFTRLAYQSLTGDPLPNQPSVKYRNRWHRLADLTQVLVDDERILFSPNHVLNLAITTGYQVEIEGTLFGITVRTDPEAIMLLSGEIDGRHDLLRRADERALGVPVVILYGNEYEKKSRGLKFSFLKRLARKAAERQESGKSND